MSENEHPTVKLIRRLTSSIFERIIRGQFDYDRDLQSLQKYQEQARQLGSQELEGLTMNYMAALNSLAGYLSEAQRLFTELFEFHREHGNTRGMATALNNRSVVFSTAGRYEEALDMYKQAEALCDAENEGMLPIYGLILSGQLSTHRLLEHYDLIPHFFDRISEIGERLVATDRFTYARVMCAVYRNMAEYHLHLGDAEEAHGLARMAVDFAMGLDLTFELANVYFTQAHIALYRDDEQSRDEAAARWQQALDLLQVVQAPAQIGRAYLEEARYLERHGYRDYAQDFAQRAYNIFVQHDMAEDVELAQALLA